MELMKEQNIEDDHVTMEESPFCWIDALFFIDLLLNATKIQEKKS